MAYIPARRQPGAPDYQDQQAFEAEDQPLPEVGYGWPALAIIVSLIAVLYLLGQHFIDEWIAADDRPAACAQYVGAEVTACVEEGE